MASFSSSPVATPFAQPNALLNLPGVDQAVQGSQRNALLNVGLSQDLSDRQTLRDNAAGLAAGDPSATATALGANPHLASEFISGLGALQGAQRQQAIYDVQGTAGLAQSILNAPPDQRAALWTSGRQQLAAAGHSRLPPEQYPGDGAMYVARGIATTALEQLNGMGEYPTTSAQSPWAYPSGTSASPSGAGGGQVGAQGSDAFSGSGGNGTATGSPPASLAGPLAQAESGGRADIQNSKGYVGKYQFGSDRLADLGLYQPSTPGEVPNAWDGTFNVPGFPQVKTLADFKRNPSAQDAAYQLHEQDIDQHIAATPGAENLDQNGLRAVAHLGGIDGMQQFVATGGRHNPSDGRTTLAQYYRRFSTGTPAVVGTQSVAPPDASPGGFGGGPAAPGAPVQVASASGTNGMPATASDASPGTYSNVGPVQPAAAAVPAAPAGARGRPGAPLNATTQNVLARLAAPADNSDVVGLDNPDGAQGLPAGTRYSVGGGSVQTRGQPAPVGGQQPGQAVTQGGGNLVVGDSIAQGIGQYNGIGGTAVQGASPQAVLGQISALNPAQVQGRNVILSGGASNDPSNAALLDQQIAALKAKGAASITVVGVGSRPDLAPLNAQLATIAQRNGAQFTGPIPSGQDGVHPTPAGYRGLGLGGNSAPVAAGGPVATSPVAPQIAAARGMEVPTSIQNGPGVTYQGARSPAAQQPSMSAQAAVAQATTELGSSLDNMDPASANAAVEQRATELMGPGAPGGQSAAVPPLSSGRPVPPPGGFGYQQNPLANLAPATAPQPQNPLLGLSSPTQSPAAAPNALLGQSAQPQPGGGAGSQILFSKGRPVPVPGMPGYVLGVDASGQRAPVRFGPAEQKFTNVGGTMVGQDKYTGAVLSTNVVGNTGRLTQLHNPDGSTSLITPSGQPVAQAGSTIGIDLGKQDYERDQKVVDSTTDDLTQLRQQEYTLRDARDVSQNLQQTGFFGTGKAQAASLIESTLGPAAAKAAEGLLGLDSASASEQFNKLMFTAASAQENQNVGARGGYNLTKAYTAANPGLQSQKETIRDIVNVQSVANAMHQDFAQGQLNHIAQAGQSFRSNPGNGYQPSSAFAQQWANSNQPRVYLAAAEALNQQDYAKWSKGLSPQEQQQALAIAGRVNNTASYMGPQGPAALTQYGAPGGGRGGDAPSPASNASAGPPAGAVNMLRQNPNMAASFDAKYGAGAARQVLGQ